MKTEDLIKFTFKEDIPTEDITTINLNLKSIKGKAELIAKEDLILSGTSVFLDCINYKCSDATVKWYFKNGDVVLKGQTIALIETNLIDLLQAERVSLNFISKLSGIATLTSCFVDQTQNTSCKILDTRKTTPLLRDLEKQAVIDGGGVSHRRDLSSGVMIKENHIRAIGSLEAAVVSIKESCSKKMTVEAHSLDDVKKASQLEVDRILLDNMDNNTLAKALEIIPSTIETEASGNMTIERIKSVAQLGVNFISVGALTHSAPTADMSLLFHWE